MLEMMFPVELVSGIGLLSGLVLTICSRIMEVREDPRLPQVRGLLPGANCGACGYAGCDAYARALLEERGVSSHLCRPGGPALPERLEGVRTPEQ